MSYFSRVMIYPYNVASRSARILKDELIARGIPCKLIRKEGSSYKAREGDLVVNWGNSADQMWHLKGRQELNRFTLLNQPNYVGYAINKAKFINSVHRFSNVKVPRYFHNLEEARWWMQDHEEHFDIIVREKLTGHGGEGAHFFTSDQLLNEPELFENLDVKLVTQYIPKKYEYRIHVGLGEVLLIQQKKRDTSIPDDQVNWKIRNNSNGFIFAVDDIVQPPQQVLDMAVAVVNKSALHFGAVDIIYNEHYEQAYVLEINTACGLEGESSRRAYADWISHFYETGEFNEANNLVVADEQVPDLSQEDVSRLQRLGARYRGNTNSTTEEVHRRPAQVTLSPEDQEILREWDVQNAPAGRRVNELFASLSNTPRTIRGG